jgi:Zn-dependent peptidase ImmA (M78 family)
MNMRKLFPADIEQTAISITNNFYQDKDPPFEAVSMKLMAEQYFGCRISTRRLSDTGDILGMTAYEDTKVKIKVKGCDEYIHLARSDIVIEQTLHEIPQYYGRMRFTIAHECAHQIFHRMNPNPKIAFECYSNADRLDYCHDNKRLDKTEWAANVLASALLMPMSLIRQVVKEFNNGKPLTFYADKLTPKDNELLEEMALFLGVSKTCLSIRLKDLRMCKILPKSYMPT